MSNTPIGKRFMSLKEFFPFSLNEHRNPTSRMLHFIGTSLIGLWIVLAVVIGNMWWLQLVPVGRYGFAWVGHAFFERNKPATFQYPLYSSVWLPLSSLTISTPLSPSCCVGTFRRSGRNAVHVPPRQVGTKTLA